MRSPRPVRWCSTAPPSRARDRAWVADEAAKVGVRMTSSAIDRLVAHLGENVSSLDGVLRTLDSTFDGRAAALGPDHVEPFLGDAGGVPPWDLTDAIDDGRTGAALALLGRMMGAGERHPLQVMAILQGHYGKLAALDGARPADRGRGRGGAGHQARLPGQEGPRPVPADGWHVDPQGDRPARRRRPRPPRRQGARRHPGDGDPRRRLSRLAPHESMAFVPRWDQAGRSVAFSGRSWSDHPSRLTRD